MKKNDVISAYDVSMSYNIKELSNVDLIDFLPRITDEFSCVLFTWTQHFEKLGIPYIVTLHKTKGDKKHKPYTYVKLWKEKRCDY